MLVAADGVEAAGGGKLELIEELVVHVVGAGRIEQGGVDVDPNGGVLFLEVLGQLLVRHQVEPEKLHGILSNPRQNPRQVVGGTRASKTANSWQWGRGSTGPGAG